MDLARLVDAAGPEPEDSRSSSEGIAMRAVFAALFLAYQADTLDIKTDAPDPPAPASRR